MATNPNPLPPPPDDTTEPRLTYDECWDLIESLFGTAGEMYAKVGGAEAFMRVERAAWSNEDKS